MAKAPKPYSRLTRNATHLGSYSSLWLGSDHLMIVRSSGYHESYVRVKLSDIKGIFVTASPRRRAWACAWGAIVVWSGAVMMLALIQHQTPIASVAFFVVSTGAFIWNHALGPGCHAYVVTGVQTAEIPPIVRLRKAQRVLARIEPLIRAAQAHLGPGVPPMPPATTLPIASEVPASRAIPSATAPETPAADHNLTGPGR